MQQKCNMPNKMPRDKRGRRQVRTAATSSTRRLHSVKDLLGAKVPTLTQVTQLARRHEFWGNWLALHLPEGLREHITEVLERDGTLTIFAESAAWSARLRYGLKELEGQLREAGPAIGAITVRVRPR
jgi:hypothetical protein